jgi:hypothetical protein
MIPTGYNSYDDDPYDGLSMKATLIAICCLILIEDCPHWQQYEQDDPCTTTTHNDHPRPPSTMAIYIGHWHPQRPHTTITHNDHAQHPQ